MNNKNEFLSGTSHEIKTLLNTIIGLSEDINSYETIPEEIREDSEGLVSASKELLELINNILDYNKIESNEMEIINTHYNPTEVLKKLARRNEKNIGDKPINFHIDIDSNLPFELIGDKRHIKEVVNNLLSNAIKYTDGGDIWFSVECINNEDNCNLIIKVKDTGRGMTEEEKNRLFNKIERLNIERNTSREGTGLGLAITKSLVDMMGGKIEVDSTPEEGSTFIFSINQKINLMEESDLSRTQRLKLQELNFAEEGYGYKKVLIVDDNVLNIKVARRALEQFDLIIEECYNGKECIDIITENNDYDLILMDIMMPVMSGEETLSKLKEIEDFNTPVIALTADDEERSEEKYKSKGFIDYIAKPFSKEQIGEKLDKVFTQREILEEQQKKRDNTSYEWEDDDNEW